MYVCIYIYIYTYQLSTNKFSWQQFSSNWIALTAINILWLINVVTGTSSSSYEKLLQVVSLHGKRLGNTAPQWNQLFNT